MLTSVDFATFREQLGGTFDRKVLSFGKETAEGFWAEYEAAYQIPCLCHLFVNGDRALILAS